MVETDSDEILRDADTEDVSLLVVGDPFGSSSFPPQALLP
jgi:diphthine methyl ester synthase